MNPLSLRWPFPPFFILKQSVAQTDAFFQDLSVRKWRGTSQDVLSHFFYISLCVDNRAPVEQRTLFPPERNFIMWTKFECSRVLDDKPLLQKREERKASSSSVWISQVWQGGRGEFFYRWYFPFLFSLCNKKKLQLQTNNSVRPLITGSTSSAIRRRLSRPSALFNDVLKLSSKQSCLNCTTYKEITNEVCYIFFLWGGCLMHLPRYRAVLLCFRCLCFIFT